jgi:hypothetical protein
VLEPLLAGAFALEVGKVGKYLAYQVGRHRAYSVQRGPFNRVYYRGVLLTYLVFLLSITLSSGIITISKVMGGFAPLLSQHV